MAKITRTFKESVVTVLTVDTTTNNTAEEVVTFPVPYTGEKAKEKLLRKLRRTMETETKKIVAIKNIEITETLRGMDAETFIANSEVLSDEQARRKNWNK